MPTVFINYRREESAGEARALYGELVDRLGPDAVFMDVDSIALGLDFRDVVQQRLASCDVMLSLVGKEWLDVTTPDGGRRIDDPRDFVRLEIEGALSRKIPVAPVLLHGTSMPSPDDLPPSIRDFAYRNAFELSHTRWESDVQEMLRRLRLTPPAAGAQSAAVRPDPAMVSGPALATGRPAARGWPRTLLALAAIGILGVALFAALYGSPGSTSRSGGPAAVDAPGETIAATTPAAASDPAAESPDAAGDPASESGTASADDGAAAANTPASDAREATPPIPRGPVRLGTPELGPETCVDVVALAQCANVPRQLWRFEAAGSDGTVRLHNGRDGAAKCLDIVNDGSNDRLAMSDCGDYTGQFWSMSWAGPRNRYVRFRSGFTGPARCLAAVPADGTIHLRMAPCSNVASQRWELRARER